MSSTPDPIIGLLSWDYGHPKGGMGRALQHVVSALQSDSCSGRSALFVEVLAPCPLDGSDHPFLAFTHRFGGQMLFSLLLPFVLNARVKRDQIAHLLLPVGPGGVLLLRRPHVPVTAIVYHSYLQQSLLVPGERWKSIFCFFERRTLSFCSQILCFSEDTKNALVDGYGIAPEKITLLPFAVALPSTSSAVREDGLCICVARLDKRKGVDVLLRAWPSIIARIPHARLIVVGDGEQREEIDQLIADTRNVERRSGLSEAALNDLVHRASIAFCPAYLEGFGMACAEAMAAGCCVIASDADGLRRLITQGKTGMLVPAGESDTLAAATIALLMHADRRRVMGMNAREWIKNVCDPTKADAQLCAQFA